MSKKQDLHDRLSRAHSWIEAAGKLPLEQKHAAFVFLFIAFNALYGQRRYEGTEFDARKDRQEFLRRIRIMQDYDNRFGQGIVLKTLKACRKPGVALIRDTFLRDTYWSKKEAAKELQKVFDRLAATVEAKLERGHHEEFLKLVLQRLTVLRNQIMHGCATYGPKSKGITSLEDGLVLLKELVLAFHTLMTKYGSRVDWPAIPYPRTGSERHVAVDQWAE
jgi:hypothetical protein